MSDTALGTIILAGFAAAIILGWHWVRRRKARKILSDEIMAGQYDQQTMTRAMVDASGDNQKARQLYIRARLRELQRATGKQTASALGNGVLILIGAYMLLYEVYNVIWGDALWWLN